MMSRQEEIEIHPFAHVGPDGPALAAGGLVVTLIIEATWAAIRVTRQAGESGAALVQAVEYALISVVEETGAQVEGILRLGVDAAGLTLMCWCLYALYQWKKGRNEEVLFWSPPVSPKKRAAKARAKKTGDQGSSNLGIVSLDSLRSKARLEEKKTSERAALPPLEAIKDVSPRPKGRGQKEEQRKEVPKNTTESVPGKSPVLRVLAGASEAQEAALQVLEESAEARNRGSRVVHRLCGRQTRNPGRTESRAGRGL